MRIISSHRLGSTGKQVHRCPEGGTYPKETISYQACWDCGRFNKLDQKQVTYELHCEVPTSDLFDFEPSKAIDKTNFPKRMGSDPLALVDQGWNLLATKLDGARSILHLTDNGIRVTLRRKNASGDYTEITRNLPHFNVELPNEYHDTILDGELMLPAQTDEATGTLGSIMTVVGSRYPKAIAAQNRYGQVEAHIFDCILYKGSDVRALPYYRRLELAHKVVEAVRTVAPFLHRFIVSEMADRQVAETFHQNNLDAGHEGSVLYHPYYPYGKTYGMIKVKQDLTLDCLVSGFEYGKKGGKYEEVIGALLISVIDEATGEYREIGKVVPGDDELRTKLTRELERVGDFEVYNLIVEVKAQVWTKGFRLRHPRVVKYRPDKSNVTVVDFTEVKRS